MRKRTVLLACIFSCIFSMTAFAGQLVQDGTEYKYMNDDGSYASGWQQDGEDWYYFEPDTGYMHKGWLVDNGKTYCLRYTDGRMMADRRMTIEGHVYEFDKNGVSTRLSDRYTGWMLDDTTWYYRFADGNFAVGWLNIKGDWYYFDENGYMVTGLIQDNGSTYYLTESGAMAHDTQMVVNGVTYDFDSSGAAKWPYKPVSAVAPEQEELWQTVASMADSVLAGIVNDNMTKRQKAEAIYAWVRGSFTYGGHTATKDWVTEAYNGFRRRHGDCFAFYATSQALLMRCGIPSIEIVRVDGGHYWNLIQLDDGNWYHFDTTPRRLGGYFCLWTDAQMAAYSSSHSGCFDFDRSLYPRTP